MKKCRMCLGTKFKKVIDFGKTPLVNSLIEKKDLDKKEPIYPLKVVQCQSCFLVQTDKSIDSQKIYKDVDYLYFSGDMPKLDEYFKEYANELKDRFVAPDDLVVEIGSNDGLMLGMMVDKTINILGVDPSSNVVVRALKRGIPTVSEFFSQRLVKSIVREYGQASLVYGNNCIAHIDNLRDIVAGVSELLNDKGVFVVECNYWGGMVKNKNYSLIYHDHFSYFTAKNWFNFAPDFGLYVFDAVVTPAQGGSLRIFMSKNHRVITERLNNILEEEESINLNSYETCKKYEYEVSEGAEKLGSLVYALKEEGKTIAGYGAAAKGFSILHLAKIDQRHLDYFVDDSLAKQGKYTPVTHIPVISREEAEDKLPDYFFITAPNYEQVIVDKEQVFRDNGGKFITSDCRII